MSSPGFKRWGATSGASSSSSYGYSRSDGTQYKSPSEEAKKKDKKDKKDKDKKDKDKKDKPAKEKSSTPVSPPLPPKPAKTTPAPSSSSSTARSQPEVVKGGLATTTYETQPEWAFNERQKNTSGQYRDGMFQGSDNPNNVGHTASSPKPTASSPKPAPKSTTSSSPSSSPSWAQKAAQSSNSKPASSPTQKPAVTSYRAGGTGNASSAYGSGTGSSSSGDSGVVKSGLAATTYEKQPDWAYAERNKSANGQYKDGMFQQGGAKVQYGSGNSSPSQLRQGGHLH